MNVELSESVINGRFKYSEKPMALPGKCAVCGSVERPVIDFGADVDGYGAVLICADCIRTAAQLVSLVEGDVQTQVVPPLNFLDVEAVNEYLARTNAANAALNSILADYVAARQVDGEATANDTRIYEESAESTESVDESDITVPVSEGPLSVSTSRSSEYSGFPEL